MLVNPTTPLNTSMACSFLSMSKGKGWLVDSHGPGHGHPKHDEAAVEEESDRGDCSEVLD